MLGLHLDRDTKVGKLRNISKSSFIKWIPAHFSYCTNYRK